MTTEDLKSIVKELILEVSEKDLKPFGSYSRDGQLLYKVSAVNLRHAREKIEALYGVKLDLGLIQQLPRGTRFGSETWAPRKYRSKEEKERIRNLKKKNFALQKLFLGPFVKSFGYKLRLPPTKALNIGLIKVRYKTPDEEIGNLFTVTSRDELKSLELTLYIPLKLFRKRVRNLDQEDFKEEIISDLHQDYSPIRIEMDIEFLPKDVIIHWVSKIDKYAGRDNIKIYESIEDDSLEGPDPDPDIEGDPYTDTGAWTSDVVGLKRGGTGMPHGFGYPGYNQKNKLKYSKLKKILFLRQVEGTSEEDEIKQSKIDQQSVRNFVNEKCPWVLHFKYKREFPGWDYTKRVPVYYDIPFDGYFENWEHAGWATAFALAVKRELDFYRGFIKYKPSDLVQSNFPHCGIDIIKKRWNTVQRIKKAIPTFEIDLENILRLIKQLLSYSPSNPKNPLAYPFYVSLYDTTRRLGGHEEGGWWYDSYELVHSVRVKNFSEMRTAAKQLLKLVVDSQGDLNGKPLIILERVSGNREKMEKPTYS